MTSSSRSKNPGVSGSSRTSTTSPAGGSARWPADEETNTAAVPGNASSRQARSISAVPMRFTLKSWCQSPIDGDSPATWASVRSGPCPATNFASPATESASVTSNCTATASMPSSRSAASRSAFFAADWLASTTRCDWPSRRAVDMPIPPPPMTSAIGSPGRSFVPVCTVLLS